jgi:NTE family protein
MPDARWHRYSNQPFRMSIKDYAAFPIKTSEGEPRLLVVSVDVQSADTVTFDSYEEESKYGRWDDTKDDYQHTIKYKDGIMVEHLVASASVPLHYDYEPVPIEYAYLREGSNYETNSYYYRKTATDDDNYKHFRYFWDGALLSNTPLIQLMRHHRDFYKNQANNLPFNSIWEYKNGAGGSSGRAPDLDIYLVNVWPKNEEDNLPSQYDYDLTKDRKSDITHHDKTEYDEEAAKIVTNYITMVKETRNLAMKYISKENRAKFDRELEEFLKKETKTKSKTSKDKTKTYEDLLKGRFNIGKVMRVERQDDQHTISDKWFDFSHETVIRMIEQGKVDTLRKVIDDLRDNIDQIIEEDSSSRTVMSSLIAHLDNADVELDEADVKLANIKMSPSDSNVISLLYEKAMDEIVLFIGDVQRMEQQKELNIEQADLLRPLTLGSGS